MQVLDVSGDCISNGSCLVLTHGKVNGDQASDKCTAESSFGEGFSPATCTAEVHCTTNDCVAGPISESLSLALLGFDAMDFRWAIDYVFPAALPGAVMLP